MYEHKENKGSLFKNKNKERDSQSDYKGTANVGGVQYWMNAWLNKDKNGDTYMGFTFNPIEEKYRKQETQQTKETSQTNGNAKPDYDDEIPF